MFILGANAAGILNKKESFLRNISHFIPGVFFIQESKVPRKGKIKADDYVIFERIRRVGGGGGLLTAVHKNLNPVSVGDDTEDEVLVIQAQILDKKVRFINAYGPQEDEIEKSKSFFSKLDEEVKSAKIAGTLVCIELDANSKLGPMFIPGDPKPQSRNGKLLSNVILENGLIVVNGNELCTGLITRHRKTSIRIEESVIDFFIVCELFFTLITSMLRKYSLTKFSTKNGEKSIKESDHNLLILKLKVKWNSSDNVCSRQEIFNFKDEESFRTFEMLTESDDDLKKCFDDCKDINEASTKWLKILNNLIKKSFKKIRIKKQKVNPELDNLFDEKESIKSKISELENKDDLCDFFDELFELDEQYDDVVDKISNLCSLKNKELVNEYLGRTKDTLEGFSQVKTWNLRKKLAPKTSIDPPAAKRDATGKLVTDKKELEELYLKTYIDRLTPNPVKEDLEELFKLKSMLFDLRIEETKLKTTDDWTMDDLENVLKTLKNNKARDAHGLIYELFKFGGQDLKISILNMFNLVKRHQVYPDIFLPANISSFHKNKGRKDDLNFDRGVFNVVKIRTILDKLILNEKYEIIDKSMSCSNIGARKGRNIRDHLFVLNGVMNEAAQNKQKNIDIQIVDIEKCFDKMSYRETANDLYEAGVQDDKFLLMAKSNEKCKVAVKTPWGSLTKRVEMNEIEMQGTVPAPLKCSVQLDSLGKECLETGEGLYRYKECVNIPPLLMIDDAIAVSQCGPDSVIVNALIQSKVEMKNLRLGHSKCFQMHVGNNKTCCPILKVHNQDMLTSNRERYLGDIITSDCRINDNIQERYNKGIGISNQIIGMLKEISFGQHYFEMAVLFRQSMLINSILCNSEVLYGLSKTHINTLESVDKYFWRKVFASVISTPVESYYIETNTLLIRHIIMGRRLMYYWNILQKDDSELVKKVFNSQKLLPVKNDWFLTIQNDLSACNITLSEKEITNMKKETFKTLVKQKIKILSKEYLISLRNNHTKSKNLLLENKIKGYLICEQLTTEDKQLLFALKTRAVDVKTNYKSMFSNLQCRLCNSLAEDESEIHVMKCIKIISDESLKKQTETISYSDIFGSMKQQISAVKILKKIFKVWKIKLEAEKLSPSGHQAHLLQGQSASYSCTAAQTVDSTSPDDSNCILYDFG